MGNLQSLLSVLDGVAGTFGFRETRFDADNLMETALRRAGRQTFRDRSFERSLRMLLDCYAAEAQLNVFGRLAAKWDVLRCLNNLLRFEAEEERHPEIVGAPIDRPVFITGFPRSGTSFLHSLLSQDQSILMPRCWQTISPYPERNKSRDQRQEQVERQLAIFQRLAPEMETLHPLNADSPQECTEITAQVFQSLRYETTHRIPSYQEWIDGHGHLDAYRFHKRFLQHLQHQQHGGEQWILKCPDHVQALSTIESVYPDCRFVFVHRDPLRVIASAAKLTEVIRRPFARYVDKKELGRQVVGRIMESANIMVAHASRADRILHIHYAELVRNPMLVIEKLYEQLDLELSASAQQRMIAFLAQSRHHGGRDYNLAEFGLDPADLSIRFESYMNCFDVHRESPAWQSPDRMRAIAA